MTAALAIAGHGYEVFLQEITAAGFAVPQP
jgi:hypothetical protein